MPTALGSSPFANVLRRLRRLPLYFAAVDNPTTVGAIVVGTRVFAVQEFADCQQAKRLIRRDLGILRSEIKEERQPKASAGDIRGVRCTKRGESNFQPFFPKRQKL